MNDNLKIKWNYEPEDYFEEPFTHIWQGYEFLLDDGNVTVTVPGSIYDSNEDIVDEIFIEIEGLFLGAQVVNNKPFNIQISERTMTREKPDGGRHFYISASSGILTLKGGIVDLIVKDSEGNIKADTKAERISERKKFAELAACNRKQDQTVEAILRSYGQAAADKENELVHLYEITESLQERFDGEREAIDALDEVSRSRWRRLRRLANSNLKQGRHRGEHVGKLRDATNEELTEARDIAKSIILAYLKYLEDQSSN